MPDWRAPAAILAALGILLAINQHQQRRDAAAVQAGRHAQARLAQSAQQRIVYPAAAQPRLVLPDGSARTIRSLLNTPRPLTYGEYAWHDTGAAGTVWIRIDPDRQILSVFRGADEIGTAVILYGAPDKPTPRGTFRILAKAVDHYSRSYDAPMPFMLRLTADGVAIHASRVRENGATHGCLGVPTSFAARLYKVATLGAPVYIMATAPGASPKPALL